MPEEPEVTEEEQEGQETQDGGPSAPEEEDNPSNRAFAKLRVERKQLQTQLEQLKASQTESDRRHQALMAALQQAAGGPPPATQERRDELEINPHDPVDAPKEHARWEAEQRQKLRAEMATAQSRERMERTLRERADRTTQAEQAFFAKHPAFSDGQGQWREDLRPKIVRKGIGMVNEGRGSAPDGSLTVEDMEKLVRAEAWEDWQTATRQQEDSGILTNLKAVEGVHAPRGGALPVTGDPNKMSTDQLAAYVKKLPSARAQAVLNALSPAKKDDLLFSGVLDM